MASWMLFVRAPVTASASHRVHRCWISATSIIRHADRPSKPLADPPAPPRLPREEQEIFEELQRQSTGAFSTSRAPEVNQSQSASSSSRLREGIGASGRGEELHPDIRLGAQPGFEGEKNPKTGEIGGPKNEPLRWGADGDWSYNGRVTDF
ncbi:Protein of unknown function (DUF1674) domain containing protein [Elaphomyces granulatus]|jgi:hypothetical protein